MNGYSSLSWYACPGEWAKLFFAVSFLLAIAWAGTEHQCSNATRSRRSKPVPYHFPMKGERR